MNWRRVREFVADREHEAMVTLNNGVTLEASPAYLKDLQRRLQTRPG